MADLPMRLHVDLKRSGQSPRETTPSPNNDDTRRVETTVFALIPEFDQVKVRDADGHVYALTAKTQGIDVRTLQDGQRVVCVVTRRLPRVLCAEAFA